jgi:hypothetical protein
MSRLKPLTNPLVATPGTFVERVRLLAGFACLLATERQAKRPAAKSGATG